MARIFSLIGSLCSTGSMRLNLAQIPGSAGFQPASEKDWLKQIDSPKIFSAQRHGTQASGLCAKRTFLSAFRWHRSGVELRWAYRPGGLCPELPKRAVRQFPPTIDELDRDNFFEVAYEHFAEAGVWELYPEVVDVLEQLRPRFELAVVSNFDGRLRVILERLGISKYFRHAFISSEIGADKPNPEVFRRALKFLELQPGHVLHVGDDPERDWKTAAGAGLMIFKLDRNKNSLRDLIPLL